MAILFPRVLACCAFALVAVFGLSSTYAVDIVVLAAGRGCGSGVAPDCGGATVERPAPNVVVISSARQTMDRDTFVRAAAMYEYRVRWERPLVQIDSQLAIARKEVETLRRRQDYYATFDRWINDASPHFESQRLTDWALTAAQERVRTLEYERTLLLQGQSLEYYGGR